MNKLWLLTLTWLGGFSLGGLATSFMVRNLILERCCGANPIDPLAYNLLDHLIPYYEFFGSGLVLAVILTASVFVRLYAIKGTSG